MTRTTLVLSSVLFCVAALSGIGCASGPAHGTLDTGLDEGRTLGSLTADETRTFCEALVAYSETETAREEARVFACTENALWATSTPEACEASVSECVPDAGYVSEIDCGVARFDATCTITVGMYERCVQEQIELATGIGREPIDCSLAGTPEGRETIDVQLSEECRAVAGCVLND